MSEASLVALATIAMVISLLLAFVPILPGPFLLWSVALVFAVVEGFTRFTPAAALATTLVMLIGTTSDFWLPLFGIRTGGLSCLSTIGAFLGGIVGSFLIPIPVIGTIIGMVGGALLVELMRKRQMQPALQAGQTAFKIYLYSYVVQLVASFVIFGVFVVSLVTTG